jgi:UDP-2,4-diacetamido-2,4,6-trideoxy-beta-L-altropyranose hydrolase
MRVIFRVDASLQIGTGHVIRCLALAKVLKENGVEVDFICRQHNGNLINKIRLNGFNVLELVFSVESKIDDKLSHSHWLGATQQQDAIECVNLLNDVKIEWMVVDHYGIDEDWEKIMRPHYNKLMVIDDLADRQHQCDLLLDQNLFENMPVRYLENIPKQCIKLLGPQYALLQPEYTELRKGVKPRIPPIKRLLIFFGGADQHNITGLTLAALKQNYDLFEVIDVVISTYSPHYETIKRQVMQSSNIHIHSDLPTLAPLMAKADMAIGAGGSTNWERLCLGLPSVVITLADNQVLVNKYLQKIGLIKLIGDVDLITKNQILTIIKNVLSINNIQSWSEKCMTACLGKGATLVTNEILNLYDKKDKEEFYEH